MKVRYLAIACVALNLAMVSCASGPSIPNPQPMSVRVVEPEELKSAYGRTFAVNPYLEPYSLIRGKQSEFVVLRYDFNFPTATLVSVDGRVVGSTGDSVAVGKSLEQMKAFWFMWEGEDANISLRLSSLERSYAPDLSFVAKAGKTSYYLVVMGKAPLPRPAMIQAFVTTDGLEPVSIELPLPALPVKK